MIEWLNETRDLYELKRGKFNFLEKIFITMKKPGWFAKEKEKRYDAIYDDQNILYNEGKIVYAMAIQINQHLYRHNNHASPSTVIYSMDPYFEEDIDELKKIAGVLAGLTKINADLSEIEDTEVIEFIEKCTNDNLRLFNIKVPGMLTEGREVFFTTIMFHREYIPGRRLLKRVFPILVLPEKTSAAIFLPGKYWSKKLSDYWYENTTK